MERHVECRVCGEEAGEDLARLWVRASAQRLSQPIPTEPEPARVEAMARRVAPDGAAAVLAVDDGGGAIACCFIEQLVEPDGSPVGGWGHLSGVAVEPDRWGEGLATAVLAWAEEAAREHGYQMMQLHVLEENERARRLYEHLGWRLTATGHEHRAGPQAVYEKAISR